MTKNKFKRISFYKAILSLKTEKDVGSFLKDLCTPAELKTFDERWLIAQLLDEGKLSYRKICKKTGASTTTISRVARFLGQEGNLGYRLVLYRFKRRKK